MGGLPLKQVAASRFSKISLPVLSIRLRFLLVSRLSAARDNPPFQRSPSCRPATLDAVGWVVSLSPF